MRKPMSAMSVLFASATVVTAVAVAGAGETGTAVIKGKVVYEGTLKPVVIQMSEKACVDLNKDKKPPVVDPGKLVYSKDGNAVPDVFVYISKGVKDKWEAPKEPVVLDQKDCMYHPHMLGLIAGQPIEIVNSDPVNHNVHSLAKKNPEFNFAQANKGMEKLLEGDETFTRPEIGLKIKCDVHSWMSCYGFVMTHPFFDVTKGHLNDGGDNAKRGAFEIKNLPAGKYTVEAWHETFGELKQEIEIKDGETKEIEFKYSEKKAKAPEVREVILGAVVAEVATPAKACCASGSVAATN